LANREVIVLRDLIAEESASGERRFRASQVAGLTEIPAYIRIANDEGMLEMALVENIQREELDAVEVAISFQRLVDEVNLTQEQLSEKVGKDRATVANYLRLLKLPPEIQLGLRQRQIGMGHARALITIGDPQKQIELFHRIVESQMSVRQVEELSRENASRNKSFPKVPKMSAAQHKQLSKQLAGMYGTRVTVKQGDTGKGRIEIAFKNDEDLDRIKKLLESR
jgi:ParB family chromosome partitioning protein